MKKSTASVGLAARIVREALGTHTGSRNTVPVMLPRKDHPLYLMPTQHAQPWGLLPMKAAALAQYPNFFNNSCMFFGSIDRDIKQGRASSILRVSKLALDLAKVLRNLGILASFQIGQKLDRLSDHDYMWRDDQEPQHISELKLYEYKFLKLNLRWDLYKPVWGSSQQTLSQTPLDVPEALPLSVVNVSRPSQPVYLTPGVIKDELRKYPSGIFMMYHHQLGLTTDAALGLLQEPGLVMAHLGLPFSHVAQIQASIKLQLQQQQRSTSGEQPAFLRDWSMVQHVQDHLAERRQELGSGPQVERQRQEIQRMLDSGKKEDEALISKLDISSQMQKELIAWQLKDKLTASQQRPRPAADGGSGQQGRRDRWDGRSSSQSTPGRDRGDGAQAWRSGGRASSAGGSRNEPSQDRDGQGSQTRRRPGQLAWNEAGRERGGWR